MRDDRSFLRNGSGFGVRFWMRSGYRGCKQQRADHLTTPPSATPAAESAVFACDSVPPSIDKHRFEADETVAGFGIILAVIPASFSVFVAIIVSALLPKYKMTSAITVPTQPASPVTSLFKPAATPFSSLTRSTACFMRLLIS